MLGHGQVRGGILGCIVLGSCAIAHRPATELVPDGARMLDAATSDGPLVPPDAGERDTAFSDLGLEATRDAGSRGDAAPDTPTEWVEHGTRFCSFAHAVDPTTLVRWHWEPCTDGLPACRMAVVDHALALPIDATVRPAGHASNDVFVWVMNDGGTEYDVVVRDDQAVLALRLAWSDVCWPTVFADESVVGLDDGGEGFWGTWDALAADPDGFWERGHHATGVPMVCGTIASATSFQCGPVMVDVAPPRADASDVYAGFDGGHQRIGTASMQEEIVTWAGAGMPSVRYVEGSGRWLDGVDTDGTDVVWRTAGLIGQGGTYACERIWAAPYPSPGEPLVPRAIDEAGAHPACEGILGHGHYAAFGPVASDPSRFAFDVYELHGGTRRRYLVHPRGPDTDWLGWETLLGAPLWVTEDELAIRARYVRPEHEQSTTLLRLDLTTLSVERP